MATKKMSLEDALLKLENIVEEMENNDTNIDKSLNLYKEGIKLATFCDESLNKYKNEIVTLKETSNNIFKEEVL